jgi:hypothetical protein
MPVREQIPHFGVNAGKIWEILHHRGPQCKERLLTVAQLTESEFYPGLGWLARENKILEEGNECYRLGTTNLTGKIGSHAGIIWKLLEIWGDIDLSSMKHLSHLEEREIYAALGWLAREDKICIDEKKRYYLK